MPHILTLDEIPIAPLDKIICFHIPDNKYLDIIYTNLINKGYEFNGIPSKGQETERQDLFKFFFYNNQPFLFIGWAPATTHIDYQGYTFSLHDRPGHFACNVPITIYQFSDTMVKPSIYCNCISPVKKRVIISRTLQYYICNNCKKEMK